MDCIPAEKTMVMKLTQDNKKKVKSPAISDTFSINTSGVYNYVINALNNKKYDEVYKILNQIKTIIRCVWKTLFTVSRYPDLPYLSKISKFKQEHKPFYDNKVLTITPRTRELDSEVLTILERNLIPPFDYDIDSFHDELWDKYLLVFDNILLSESIQYRKELKINRDMKLKELAENKDETYDQQYNLIISEYDTNIDSLKQQYIFKIVNFLNWLYYNNENKDMAWSTVLLRLSVMTKNKYHNEQYKHDENDFADYLRQLTHTNKRELLELYVAVIVYKYQFIEHSIISYDKTYIETMIHYLTDTLPTFEEYINGLLVHVYDNIQLLRLLIPTEQLMEYILNNCLNIFSFRVKPLYERLLTYYTRAELSTFGITQRVDYLISSGEICKMFNKMSNVNYKQIADSLDSYSEDIVMKCFKQSCLSNFGPYTKFVIQYMLTRYDKQFLDNEIIHHFGNQKTVNKMVNPLYGLLMSKLSNQKYYDMSSDKIMTLMEASNNNPDEDIKTFIILKAKELLNNAKGYDKFQLENIIENIQ